MSAPINSALSISIPTYNRADFLDYSLKTHVPLFEAYGIQVFICDNASTDNTYEVVEKWKKNYPLISYYRNETNLGPDENIERALKVPDTDYIWLMGDTYLLPKNGIPYILNLLKKEATYDIIVSNLFSKLEIPTTDYKNHNELLGDLGALMSCLSCLIYHKSLISTADFSRYRDTSFLQTGIIFEHLSRIPFNAHWAKEVSITSLNKPGLDKTSWASSKKIFDIGIEKWVNFIFSLPAKYTLEKKLEACVGFGQISQAFTIKGMMILRAQGVLDYEIYRKFKKAFQFSLGFPAMYVLLITMIPRSALKFAIATSKRFR
ncbi:glycosyltransferase family 2 protein [Pseudomonas protegens]|uniref:glycosyltransferase family 2 protein n=1 Tax=Pseudomonas protegens TaxID=380021 RepID=UPI00380A8878